MIRRDFTSLTSEERSALGAAFNQLWTDGLIVSNADLHDDNFTNGIHWGPAFLPWHRDFLRKLEVALNVPLPYWDWTRADSRDLDAEPWLSFFGGRSNNGGLFDHWTYFRNSSPGTWVLPTLDDIVSELEPSTFLGLRALEAGSHVPGHTWTGGTMASGRSPLDPLFYLHHCNLDRIWAIWQLNNAGAEQYEHTGVLPSDSVPEARVPVDSPMVGGATPGSMLDHAALDYTYSRDEALESAWYDKHETQIVTHV